MDLKWLGAIVDRSRFALQVVGGGDAFRIHIYGKHEHPIADTLLYGLVLDVNRPDNGARGTWPEIFEDTL